MKRLLPGAFLLALAMACEPGARVHDPATTPQSTTIAALADGTILSLDADHDALVFVDKGTGRAQSVAVGKRPSQLTVRGDVVAVSNRGERTVSILNTANRSVTKTIPVGVEPTGLAFLPDGRLAVALSGEQALAIVDVNSGTVAERIPLGQQHPRAVAVLPDGRVYVSHVLSGELSVVRPGSPQVDTVDLQLKVPSQRLNASLVQSMTVAPDGKEVSTGHVNLNNENLQPDPNTGSGGYQGGPTQMPGVNPTVTVVDTDRDIMVSDATPMDEPSMGCFECGTTMMPGSQPAQPQDGPTSALLNNQNGSLRGRQLNEPVAVAYLDGGRLIAVLGRGSKNVMFFRRDERGQRKDLVKVARVGDGADGLAVTPDGKQLLVHSAFDLEIDVIDIPLLDGKADAQGGMMRSPTEAQAKQLNLDVQEEDRSAHPRLKFAEVTLPADVQAGRKLFFDATLPTMTSLVNGATGISCATCHVDGRNDGRNWQFIDGPRNTPSLAGAAEGRKGIATTTAPLHWGGELTTHRDLQRTVTEFMGGAGLSATELDSIAAFIDTIPEPDNVYRTDLSLLAQVQRGEELFHDPAVGCTECHRGDHKTDNQNYDVGTGMWVQTPVLHGVHLTAPYLHDGSAATIEDVLERLVAPGLMGNSDRTLNDDDLAALAAYLRSL